VASSESGILSYLDSQLNVRSVTSRYSELINSVSEELLINFIRNIYFEFKNNPTAESEFSELFELVEVSPYSTSDWINNLNIVYNWLCLHNRSAKFCDILQYVSCYFESQSSDSIEVFLELFGFERSKDRN
jgi:hypothetical protein